MWAAELLLGKSDYYLQGFLEYYALVFKIIDQFTVADPGFSKWGGAVLSQMGGRTSCFQVKSA